MIEGFFCVKYYVKYFIGINWFNIRGFGGYENREVWRKGLVWRYRFVLEYGVSVIM